MYKVEELYQKYHQSLNLQLVAGKTGLTRSIKLPEAHRPGLSLSGYLKGNVPKRILVFGRTEMEYLRDLPSEVRTERLNAILTPYTPAVFIARRYMAPKEFKRICDQKEIALFRSDMTTPHLLSKLTLILSEEFAPSNVCHGTLVEVFGLGVLIQGNSSVGKSETALGLIERGHRLIADDVVKVSKREGDYLEGAGTHLTKHMMEIRGIGIINVAHLYGAVCVRENKSINIVVYLETWADDHSYERVGLEEKSCDILGCPVPFYVLPVKPGRDVVLLLETIALNHRLKQMGLHSAQEFSTRLQETIAQKSRKGKK